MRAALLLVLLAACSRRDGTVRASGSSAFQPLVLAAKERFEATHRETSVELSVGGSQKGLADVAAGAVHLGNSDVFAPPDMTDLVDHKVAVVGFAPVAHKGPHNEAVRALSREQLARIFTGAVRSWKDVGGADQPIVVINRAPGSGTRAVFARVIMGSDAFVESQTEDSSGTLVAKLRQTRGAISYVALPYVDEALKVLPLAIEGRVVEASVETITTDAYPLWGYEHVYTKGPPVGVARAFLDYMLSPAFQDEVLPRVRGYVPVSAMKVRRDGY